MDEVPLGGGGAVATPSCVLDRAALQFDQWSLFDVQCACIVAIGTLGTLGTGAEKETKESRTTILLTLEKFVAWYDGHWFYPKNLDVKVSLPKDESYDEYDEEMHAYLMTLQGEHNWIQLAKDLLRGDPLDYPRFFGLLQICTRADLTEVTKTTQTIPSDTTASVVTPVCGLM